jgi:hypothetical protein
MSFFMSLLSPPNSKEPIGSESPSRYGFTHVTAVSSQSAPNAPSTPPMIGPTTGTQE